MKTLHLYFIPIFAILIGVNSLHSQNMSNQSIVQNIYEVLQIKNATSAEIALLTEPVIWDEILSVKKANNDSISLSSIVNMEWQSISFKDLNFQLSNKNEVLATGIVSGRKATECEYISTRFKHYWSLKDGKIISFTE